MIGNTAISALLTYVGAYLVEVHGLTPAEVGWAFSLSGAGLIAGGILGSRLARRFPARSLAVALMLLRGAIMAAMLLVPAELVGHAANNWQLARDATDPPRRRCRAPTRRSWRFPSHTNGVGA